MGGKKEQLGFVVQSAWGMGLCIFMHPVFFLSIVEYNFCTYLQFHESGFGLLPLAVQLSLSTL